MAIILNSWIAQFAQHSDKYLKFLAYEEAISNDAFLRLKSQLKKDFEKVKNDFEDEYNSLINPTPTL